MLDSKTLHIVDSLSGDVWDGARERSLAAVQGGLSGSGSILKVQTIECLGTSMQMIRLLSSPLRTDDTFAQCLPDQQSLLVANIDLAIPIVRRAPGMNL